MIYSPRDGRSHQSVDPHQTDYPGTMLWSPAATFLAPRRPRQIRFVVIHITGGPALDEGPAIHQFRGGGPSAHYIVNREGRITQMVRDAHIANHVDSIHSITNRDSIGIEHVNPWNRVSQLHPTGVQYAASARLVAWLCATYSIPVVHSTRRGTPGIRGHIEEQPHSSHVTCPNPAWDWEGYIDRVRRAFAAGPSLERWIAATARR
jgi:N-acetyl-anhydromuramyl-L-alanine amidase AmpD